MRAAVAEHLGSREVTRVLYGSIIGLALIVALEAHPPSAAAVAVSLVATAIATALAELYSEVVGTETRTRARVGREQLVAMLDESLAVAVGVAFPSVFFLLAALETIELETAFDIAKWSGLGLITAYAFGAARLTGSTVMGSVRRAGVAGLVAAFLIVIKALVH